MKLRLPCVGEQGLLQGMHFAAGPFSIGGMAELGLQGVKPVALSVFPMTGKGLRILLERVIIFYVCGFIHEQPNSTTKRQIGQPLSGLTDLFFARGYSAAGNR